MSFKFSLVALFCAQLRVASICLTATAIFMASSTPVSGQVSETANRWIRGVAHVSLDRSGKSQITFNPRRCRELGPELCEFFRTHEYGHVNLRHLERGVPAPQAELEADLWAAKNASPSAVQAAKKFFLSGQGGSRVHGSPQERARRMDSGSLTTVTAPVHQSVKRVAPKTYAAIPKRTVRYVVKKPAVTTAPRITNPVKAPSKSRAAVTQTTPKTIRYVVKTPPKQVRSGSRSSGGYVPRGDFLNPR